MVLAVEKVSDKDEWILKLAPTENPEDIQEFRVPVKLHKKILENERVKYTQTDIGYESLFSDRWTPRNHRLFQENRKYYIRILDGECADMVYQGEKVLWRKKR